MSDSRWYFTEEQLNNSPSRKCGINAEQELSYRQRAANLIQEMGQRLQVSQLCINTAIVYMHRFYAFHSFTLFHRNSIAAAAFFLAAKVEEQPRKLEHVIKILNICLEKNENTRENYAEQAQELVFNENVLLQTLGFDVAIDHPHTHVVRACQLFNIVTVSRELRQTCYFMASNSLHLTTMCLKYRPTVVAAFCIYIACQWSRWEIPDSSEGKAWYSYVDENVTTDTLKKLTEEYLQILERSPSKFKSKMKAITSNGQTAPNQNPSVHSRDDGPSTSHAHHRNQHDRHHHHHGRSNSGSSSNNLHRKQPQIVEVGQSSSKQSQHPSVQATTSFKSQNLSQSSSNSSSLVQRPTRPSGNPQPHPQISYSGNNDSNSNTQKSLNEDRTQHRQVIAETSVTFTGSSLPRPIVDSQKRLNSSQQSINMPSHQQQQQQPQQNNPHIKPTSHDQRHVQPSITKTQLEYHQKGVKQNISGNDFTNRSTSSTTQPMTQKQGNHIKPSQVSHHQQTTHSNHPNINYTTTSSTTSNVRSNSQSLPSYNESTMTKQASISQQSSSQSDFWFNDNNKLQETSTKVTTPPSTRPSKSMFSPSPENDAFDRTKMLMMNPMNASVKQQKQNESPKIDKQDRRSSTPSKKERKPDMAKLLQQNDRKPINSRMENSSLITSTLINESSSKKRPFTLVDDGISSNEYNRDNKTRKVEHTTKVEPPTGPIMKQPIETNPDIVKSLLQECYTSNKFDSFGMDSPLDVINPEAASIPTQLNVSFQSQTKQQEPLKDTNLISKLELSRDNGFDDDHHHKKSKSKKKKDKHRHKETHKPKKKKSHKSDREDRDDRDDQKDSSLKIILSKEKSDSKSSPENVLTPGGLKIKIPIKDVAKSELSNSLSPMPPAPLKLKISKEKFSAFNNSGQTLNDGGLSASSSHKKRDKDRSKSKTSKHGNNNNNSDFKDVGFQHQQLSVNKKSSQAPMQQCQTSNALNPSSVFGNNSFQQQQHRSGLSQHLQHQQRQQAQQYQQHPTLNPQFSQQQNVNDIYHNPNVNYTNVNNNSNISKK